MNGTGKTTLVNLISGLLTPKKGTINVNDHNIKDILKPWQNIIGFIPQDIYLIDDTIEANIALGVDKKYINDISKKNPKHIVVSGGKSRFESSYNGILACPKNSNKVLINDAARPFISQEIITSCIEALNNYEAVVTSIQTTDTVIRVKNMEVLQVEDRNQIFLNQTPQGFKYKTILDAHKNRSGSVTDDISLLDLNETKCKRKW